MQTYQEALDYLYSFDDFERQPAVTRRDAEFNLDRTRALLAAVSDPHLALNSVVVAGTKGKGSVCAMIESIARAAGYRTGLWTSPHLNTYRERIQIDRQIIMPDELVAEVGRLCHVVETFDATTYGQPTTFELGFVMALRRFVEQGVQCAVLEVGLGGIYDCANVVSPLVSAISAISYDHTHVLGNTLSEIARSKAGIMKPGVPVATAPQPEEAADVLRQVADAVGAPLWFAEQNGLCGLHNGFRPYPASPVPALRGAFQHENARLAVGAALLLCERGLALPDDALSRGLATVQWPGRLETVGQSPLLTLDGAHNGDSARKLVAALREEFTFERLVFVLGASRDKDIAAIIAELAPHADALVITHSRHPRALANLDEIEALARPQMCGSVLRAPAIREALDAAYDLATPADLICVTGSLFVVGAAREALGLAVSD